MRDSENGREILSVEQTAEYLQIPVSSVYKLAQSGNIPAMKVGKRWRFSRRRLEDHVAQVTKE